jgi:hypothetical protein
MKSSTKTFRRYFGVIFTDRFYSIANSIGIYRQKYSIDKYRRNYNQNKKNFKKPKIKMTCIFYGCFYRRNYSWIQTGKVIQWRVTFTDKLANGLTDKTILSVNPSVIVNIWISHWHSHFLFLLLPLCNKTNPPQNLQLTALPHPPHHPPSFLDFSNHISNFITNFLF